MESTPKIYKFIQMNVWHWRLYWPMRRFLERERPDYIAAQEGLRAERHRVGDYYTNQGLIDEGLAHHYVEAPGTLRDVLKGMERHMCVTAFGQTPLTSVSAEIIPQTKVLNDHNEFAYHRLLHVTTELDGRKLNLLTYHGRINVDRSLPAEGRLGCPPIEEDFARIAAYISTLDGPVIFSGDFNLYASAPALAPLKALGLVNLIERDNITVARNSLAWSTNEAVSHLFVSPHINVHDFHVAEDIVSDHQPLVMNFSLKTN